MWISSCSTLNVKENANLSNLLLTSVSQSKTCAEYVDLICDKKWETEVEVRKFYLISPLLCYKINKLKIDCRHAKKNCVFNCCSTDIVSLKFVSVRPHDEWKWRFWWWSR